MPDKQQPEPLRIAALLEKTGAQGSLRDEAAAELRRQHAELETLRAKLKTNEDLGDAGSDVQLLRMGYAAARLEIESLKAQQPGAVYAELPEPHHRGPAGTGNYFNSFTADQMRAFADATCAMRASHGQAPAGAARADSVQEDAARYRWLAASCRSTSEHWGGRWSIIIDGPAPKSHDSEDDFDAAVDAARKQGGAT